MSKNRGPKAKKQPRKPKPEGSLKARARKREQLVQLIGCYVSKAEAFDAAVRRGISAEIVPNGNNTYSLRRVG